MAFQRPESTVFRAQRVEKPWGHEVLWAWSESYAGKVLEFGITCCRRVLSQAESHELIEVVNATDEEAELLGGDCGTALLSIIRTTVDADGHPFEFSRDLFRGDRVRIAVRSAGKGLRGQARRDGDYVEFGAVDAAG